MLSLVILVMLVAVPTWQQDLEVCSQSRDAGPCKALFRRFYWNAQSGKCEKFIFGGCLGNSNNFKTLEECSKLCSTP
ncbi:kunitz-type serine protease inhibitor HCRG21-like [Gigantopelta aegis]|uniref:kunitz-type serine protease inhibitor HCRG21-like n=1 Tax=Gigantopelta aegis TaxID=1735272 RepID=UPI001B88C8F1|nr:kunitz-type serine protease inhibitor HCRG21-like [Gigantopelta aegis]